MELPVTIAVLGCGPRAMRGHVPGIQECPEVRLIAVCDLLPELARAAAEELGVEPFTDHRALLARPELEAVVIVTATPFHEPLARDALEAGKHVFLEKPMAATAAACEQLCRLAEARGLVGAVGYQNRFRPRIRWLHREARRVDPVQVLIDRPRGMMADKYLHPDPHFGIMDYISHDLDLALWLIGEAPSAVTAVLQRGLYTDRGAIENASVQVEFGRDGMRRVVTLQSTMGDGGLPTRYQVIGRSGCAALADGGGILTRQLPAPGTLTGYRAEVETTEVPDGPASSITAAMLAAFAAAVRGCDPGPLATFSDGASAMRLHEAIIDSDRRNERSFPLA